MKISRTARLGSSCTGSYKKMSVIKEAAYGKKNQNNILD